MEARDWFGLAAVLVSLCTAVFTLWAARGANAVSDKEADTNIAKITMELLTPYRLEVDELRKGVTRLTRRVGFLERFIRNNGLVVPTESDLSGG